MAIDLRRVTHQDFAAELLGEPGPQHRFPRSCWPENDHKRREITHAENSRSRIGRASGTSAARGPTRSARLRWTRAASLSLRVIERKIIKKDDPETDIRSVKLRGQRFERIRYVDRGHRGVVERLFARRPFKQGVGRPDAAIAI